MLLDLDETLEIIGPLDGQFMCFPGSGSNENVNAAGYR